MNTIYKYTFESPELKLDLPVGAELLCVMNQNEKVCLWVKLDPKKPTLERLFQIVGTGHPVSDESIYIGTCMVQAGAFVWHVFEEKL